MTELPLKPPSPQGFVEDFEKSARSPTTGFPCAALWRLDDKLAGLENILSEIRLLSLDVFDTLVFRTCREPRDVFLATGRRALEEGVIRKSLTAEEYQAVRTYALDLAYRSSSVEPRLEDLLAELPLGIGDRRRLLELEVATEIEHCYLNPSVFSLLQECRSRGIQIALLSDMYLGRDRILDLLQKSGFDPSCADYLLVSVDEGAMKADGLLYRKLLAACPDIKPGQVLHLGDNRESDVAAARREGIRAFHYDTVRSDCTGILDYERIRHGELLPELHALRSLATCLGADLDDVGRRWFRIGAGVLGPFLAAFCDWVVDTAIAEGADTIAPFMREAATLAPMLRRAVRERGVHIPVVPLFVSREAVVLAGKRHADEQLVRSLFENREHFQVRDLFRSLELGDVSDRFVAFEDSFLGEAWKIPLADGRTLLDELSDFLMARETRRRIDTTIRRRRIGLLGYLERSLAESKQTVTVDLGFLGQIQMGLDSVLKQEGKQLELIHLMAFGKSNSGELLGRGTDIRGFAGSAGLNIDLIDTIHRSAPVLEQLLMGREGSTLGYRELAGRGYEPILETDPLEEWEHSRKEAVQAGVCRFHDLWLHFRRVKPQAAARVQRDKQGWCRLIHRMIDMPTADEARFIGSLHNDCNFGSSRVVPVCPPEEEEIIRGTGAYEYYRFMRHRSTAVWPQGAVTRVDAGAILSHWSAGSANGYLERMLAFSQSILKEGVREVVAYGAGLVGRNLIRAARFSGLRIICAVDRNRDLWGTRVEGVEVKSMDEAIGLGNHRYAIASLAFTEEIRRSILAAYADGPEAPRIFIPN